MRKLIAEALGIDATKALGLFLTKNDSDTGLRCAVANFSANNGLLTANTLVIDTDQVVIQGQGTINLNSEALDFTLNGHPKKFRLIRVAAPIAITGQLGAPKIGIKPGKAPLQAAAAVALAVVATPAAAVLPFIDPGLAHNADCAGLLTQARAEGAPVKTSALNAAAKAGAAKH
ncbi:MAG: hypothetical protein JO303_17140 [Caulobacteraceae bacterium]|nr:hypothetical protein [Caulobacteraceae bacterium]